MSLGEFIAAAFEVDRHPMEWLYWVSQIVLVIVATGTAIFAGWQLWFIRLSHRHETESARAAFLFELDGRWNSDRMVEARRLLVELKAEVEGFIDGHYAGLDKVSKAKKASEEFSKRLQASLVGDRDKYLKYLRIVNYFETVGVMIKNGYVDRAILVDLYLGAILQTAEIFEKHLKRRQEEANSTKLYEHTMSLFKAAREILDKPDR